MRPHVWCEFRSLVWFCARVVHWKVKVTRSLTDVWQQLFEQQDITAIVLCTIHFHPWLHENHTSASARGHTDWKKYAGTCLSETSEVCPWAKMASDWNMVSNQQSFIIIDQSINQWRDCLIVCLKAKSKHFEHLLWCVYLSQYSTVVLTVVRVMIAKYRKQGIWCYHSSLTPEPIKLKLCASDCVAHRTSHAQRGN